MAIVGNQGRIIACLHEAPVVITAMRVVSWIVDSSARSATACQARSWSSSTLPIGPSNTRAATFRRYDMRTRDTMLATS